MPVAALLLATGIRGAPPIVDGTAVGVANTNVTSVATAAGLTTTLANDLIVIGFHLNNGTGASSSVSSISGGGLTYTRRKQLTYQFTGGNNQTVELWTAPAPATLSNVTITATLSGTVIHTTMAIAAFAQINTNSIFDPDASIPATADNPSNASSTQATVNINTTNVNDLIIGLVTNPAVVTYVAGSGYTIAVQAQPAGTGTAMIEYKVVSAAQTNLAVNATPNQTEWGLIADALNLL